MRILLAAIMIGLLTVPSFAQMGGGGMGGSGMGGGKKHKTTEQKSDPKKAVDEKAYKSALDALPNRPYDPWSNVRGK